MLNRFRSLLGRQPSSTASSTPAGDAPQPDRACYLVGDLHGRADLLELMLELIDAHIGGTGSADPQLVFLGDYVDHGPTSAAVLSRLQELTRDFPENVTCLMGNHDRMMLDFLSDPVLRGPRWLRNGGRATLESYRISLNAGEAATPEQFGYTADALAKALGPTKDWLAGLPLSWSSGNLWAVHAGADPMRPMDQQSARVLLWGHPEFDSAPRSDGQWVAHGHIEFDQPAVSDGRIALDTAAWSSDRLTACAIKPDGHYDFLQT